MKLEELHSSGKPGSRHGGARRRRRKAPGGFMTAASDACGRPGSGLSCASRRTRDRPSQPSLARGATSCACRKIVSSATTIRQRQFGNDNSVRYKVRASQIAASRRHFVKASIRVHEYPDRTPAIFHGPSSTAPGASAAIGPTGGQSSRRPIPERRREPLRRRPNAAGRTCGRLPLPPVRPAATTTEADKRQGACTGQLTMLSTPEPWREPRLEQGITAAPAATFSQGFNENHLCWR